MAETESELLLKVGGKLLGLGVLLLLFLALGIPSIMLYSFTLTKLWLWFLVPTFECPPLSLAQGYGIILIAAMLTHQADVEKKKTEEESPWAGVVRALMLLYGRPLLTLLFGWITAQLL